MAFVDNGKDSAGRQNIDFTFARGDTKGIQFTLDDGASTPSPIDLTGATVALSVHSIDEPTDSTTLLFELTGTITDAVNGVVQFRPTRTQATQTPDTYFYDVQVILASGVVCSVAAGRWTYVADRTDVGETS